MNNIMNLVSKELIFIKGSMKMQLIICAVFIMILPILNPTLTYYASIIIPYFLVYGTMAFEERSKGDVLGATLPVSRREICLSKYVLGILYTIGSVLVSVFFMRIGIQFVPSTVHQSLQGIQVLPIAGLLTFVGILYTGIMIPIILKYGTEKSRFIMLFMYIIAFFGVSTLGNGIGGWIQQISPIVIVLVAVGVYIVSIVVSLRIYEKKEFR